MKLYVEAEKIFDKYKMYRWQCALYGRYKDVYNKLNDKKKEMEYALKLISVAKKAEDTKSLATSYETLAEICMDNKQYDIARKYLDTTIVIGKENEIIEVIITGYYNSGYLENQVGNQKKALEYYQKSYEYSLKTETLLDDADVMHKFGLTYFRLKEYDNARKYLLQSVEISKKYNFEENLIKVIDILAEVEYAAGNYKKAVEYRNLIS